MIGNTRLIEVKVGVIFRQTNLRAEIILAIISAKMVEAQVIVSDYDSSYDSSTDSDSQSSRESDVSQPRRRRGSNCKRGDGNRTIRLLRGWDIKAAGEKEDAEEFFERLEDFKEFLVYYVMQRADGSES